MPTETLILHNYAFWPFGQKVRSMLGYSDLSWLSVEVPPQPPRPSLDPMITGYRKSPVAQIGADLFCDTRTIAEEIARISGREELSPLREKEEEQAYLGHLEGTVFAACLGALPKGKVVWKLLTTLGWGLPSFLKDRAALGAGGGLDVPSATDAEHLWQSHLADLDQRVGAGFLGGTKPNFVDFSAYHVLWFYDLMSDTKAAGGRKALSRWQDQMAAFGSGHATALDASGALATAKSSQPRPVTTANDNPNMGCIVRIAPTDYGRDETEGTLVGSSSERWTIRRATSECGQVHVHFPTRGYRISSGSVG